MSDNIPDSAWYTKESASFGEELMRLGFSDFALWSFLKVNFRDIREAGKSRNELEARASKIRAFR